MNFSRMTTLLLAVLLFWPAGSMAQEPGRGGPPPAPVEVARVISRDLADSVTLTADAQPHRRIRVASRVEEMVERVLVEEGQTVEAGRPLVQLYCGQMELRLLEAKAALAEAEARLAQLRRDLERNQVLYAKKSLPLKNLEDARTAVRQQEAVVDQVRKQVELADYDLKHTLIRAPLGGQVVSREVEPGEWVKKGGTVAVVSVLDPVQVQALVPERYTVHLKEGQEVCCTADALPGRTFCGRIRAIIAAGDPASRTFPVQVLVDNPQLVIKPGMLIRVKLAVGSPRTALMVPKDALVISGTGHQVFVVQEGKAHPVDVKLGEAQGPLVEVKGDLQAGWPVVSVGNERLRPGQPVKIRSAAPGDGKN